MMYVPGTKAHRLQKKLNEGTWHDFASLQNQAGGTADNTRHILRAIGAATKGQENTNTEKWSLDLPDLDKGLLEPEQLRRRTLLLYRLAHPQPAQPAQPEPVQPPPPQEQQQLAHPAHPPPTQNDFRAVAEQHFYITRDSKIYLRDGSQNNKEALGFIKDWVSSLITLDTAAIGAIGAFISFKDFPHLFLSTFPLATFITAGLGLFFFTLSISEGVLLLNALPGAIQRFPVNDVALRSDVFSIANERRYRTLNAYSKGVRWGFVLGVSALALFIGVQMLAAAKQPPKADEQQRAIADLANASNTLASTVAIEQRQFQQSQNEITAALKQLVAEQPKQTPSPGLPRAQSPRP